MEVRILSCSPALEGESLICNLSALIREGGKLQGGVRCVTNVSPALI